MEARVQRWGNSLALRIPKLFASEVGIEDNSSVKVELIEGKLVITPILESPPTLEDLLTRINEGNLHGEISTGQAVGRELW